MMLPDLHIGPHRIATPLIAAPMAGVTDRPFRQLCRKLGASAALSEMLTSDRRLWHTRKSRLRMDHRGEPGPIWVQIAGGEPQMLAEAAQLNAEFGAQIIDINMGCPAKKVCNVMAGSALLSDTDLVARLLDAVVSAVDIPVTLKIRTGPAPDCRNGLEIARIAENAGISLISVHGRTRAEAYRGEAEYHTIREIKQNVSIPVIANGDIDSPQKAAEVIKLTQADGLMIGRAAQGNPWIFQQIRKYLADGEIRPGPDQATLAQTIEDHLHQLHHFYGEYSGVRIARKHIGWYLKSQQDGEQMRRQLMQVETAREQIELIRSFFTPDANVQSAA